MENLFVIFVNNFRLDCKGFEVKDDFRNVFFDAFNRGHFMFYATVEESNAFNCCTGQRGKQNSSETVANSKTETFL